MDTLELLFDGDVRGYRTGKDCVLDLCDLWDHPLSEKDIEIVKHEQEGWIEIVDEFIDRATIQYKGHQWTLQWVDGSIFAYRDDHVWEEE